MQKQAIPLLILLALAGCVEKTETAGGPAEPKPEKIPAQNWLPICLNGGCGYFDAIAKQFAIEPHQEFESVDVFGANGLARVQQYGKYGYINTKGQMIVPAQFKQVQLGYDANRGFAANGLTWVVQDDKRGYIDTKGQMVIAPQFEWADGFAANGLAVVQLNGKYGYIDTKGQMVIPAQFEYAEKFSANGLAAVKQNGKYGYIDAKGEMVIPAKFKDASSFSVNGLANVEDEQNNKEGYIDTKGRLVVPAKFDYANSFADNGLAVVRLDGKYGYIDDKGQMVIPAQFEDADYDFVVNGLAQVKLNGKYGYIDTKGQMVIPAQFENTQRGKTTSGLSYVKANGKYGYIDIKGQMVIAPQFEDANSFDANGFAWVKGSKSGYIDTKGKWILYTETVCDTPVVKNADDQVIWPKKPVADICAEATYAKQQADAAKQRAEEQACSHVYVGKEFRAKAGIFDWEQTFIVEGFSKATQQVTIRSKGDSYRQEISCYVPVRPPPSFRRSFNS